MKKLVLVLTAVCAVGMAKGAFVDWKFGKDTTYNGYTVYAFDNADSATVLAALGAFDADALTTINGLVLSSAEVKKGNANSQGVDVGDVTSLMLLAINGAFEVDKAFVYDTLNISNNTYGGTDPNPGAATLASFGNSGTITAKALPPGPDPSTDVPEPTSGLLLVLGGAMLALRRRRA